VTSGCGAAAAVLANAIAAMMNVVVRIIATVQYHFVVAMETA
jgi:hypothetical protein